MFIANSRWDQRAETTAFLWVGHDGSDDGSSNFRDAFIVSGGRGR